MRRLDWNLLKKKFHEIKFVRIGILFLAMFGNSTQLLNANPQNPVITSGSATFSSPDPLTLQIKAGNNTIINWEKFSINPAETTSFIQPGSSSAILNRVTGNDISHLLGSLQANGNVYLINPNGILIGKDSVINTAGFLASTLDLSDSDFLAGKDLSFVGSTKNGVVNLGTIKSTAGDIVLLGYTVDNRGNLQSDEGAARLGAGTEILLQVNGSERLVIHPKTQIDIREGTGLNNNGSINAVMAELKADGNPYILGINHEGQINATGIVSKNGQVYLKADQGAIVMSGTIKATNADQTGGNVTVLGDQINLLDHSVIDVSGDHGGGTAFIGGGYQGKDVLLSNAKQVYVSKDVIVKANANLTGDGGTIIHWSDDSMFFYGHASAKGGTESGNGGFIETSGKSYLDYRGLADLTATSGNKGMLLLDPANLTISGNASANIYPLPIPAAPPSPYPYYDIYPFPSTTNNSNLLASDLQTALSHADVVIQTGNDNGTGAGDIIWNTNLTLPVGAFSNLTLDSFNNIVFIADTGAIGYDNHNSTNLVDFNLKAQGNIIIQGGISTSQNVTILVNNNMSLTAINGDIRLEGGQGQDSFVNISASNIDVFAQQGSLKLFGGSSATSAATNGNTAYLSANKTLNINTGTDCILYAGTGLDSAVKLNGTTNLNMNILGNCSVIGFAGGALSGSSQGTHATIVGGIIEASVGKNLLLQGGVLPNNYATITSTKDINISVEGDIQMLAGQASGTFTQIGSTTNSATNNITISKIGGNLVLDTNPPANTDIPNTNAYCAIGHGNLNSTINAALSGRISILGSPSSSLILNGPPSSTATNTFAQIGHFQGTSVISGFGFNINADISVNNFGDINLNPGGNYALIGHGYPTLPISSMAGNISLLTNTGNVNLNAGIAQNTFAQIGHINAAISIYDITVNTTGNVNLTAGNFQSSEAIIGFGNFYSPNAAVFSGNINVSGQNINLLSGINGPYNNVVIGFEPGDPATARSCSIVSTSTVAVTALNDILIRSQDGLLASGGNAIIGHEANADSSANSSINTISVIARNGDITLMGGNVPSDVQGGKAFIGTDSNPLLLTTPPTSNIIVDAPNGTIFLYGNTPLQSQFIGGTASILNGNFIAAPFYVNVSAQNIYLNAGISNGSSNGNAYICSTGNLNVNTIFDLQLLGNSFASNTHGGLAKIHALSGISSFDIGQDLLIIGGDSIFAQSQIGSWFNSVHLSPISTTFSIGRDLTLKAGSRNANALIGYAYPTQKCDLIFKNIGGNVLLQAGNESYVSIGLGIANGVPVMSGDIIFENIGSNGTGGNVTLIGNPSDSSFFLIPSFAQIGHNTILQSQGYTVSGDIRLNRVGGAVTLTSGGQFNYTQIGHGSLPFHTDGEIFSGDVVVNAESVTLTGGTAQGSDAIIGYATSTNLNTNGTNIPSSNTVVNSNLIQVSSNGPVTLTAGNDSNAVIGYYNPQSTDDNINIDNINVSAAEGNITLNAGFTSSNQGGVAIIGTLLNNPGKAHSSIKITTPKDLLLKVGVEATGHAFIINTNDTTTWDGRLVRLDPSRIILLGGSGLSKIFSSGDLDVNFTDALHINYDASNPTSLQSNQAIIQALGEIRINTEAPSFGDIVILGLNNDSILDVGIQSRDGSIRIGTPSQPGAGNISLGTSDMLNQRTVISSAFADIDATISGNLNIQGGDISTASASIQADKITINAGGNIELDGNNSTATITSVSLGNITLLSGKDFIGTGNSGVFATEGGNILTVAAWDILISDLFSFNSNGTSNSTYNAGRTITMSDLSAINFDSSGTLQINSQDIVLNDSSMIDVTKSGDLFIVAQRHLYLNDSTVVETNGGSLNLTVDNEFPDPNFYGRGRFIKAVNASINTHGGPLNIFTSTQPFNSISGLINGTTFTPGIQFLNTPFEQWHIYFETAINGFPYTIFYKNRGTPDIPVPPPRIPSKPVHQFEIALFEALQEWRYLDELDLVPAEFCVHKYIIKKCATEYYMEPYGVLRKQLITYNTKKLMEIINN